MEAEASEATIPVDLLHYRGLAAVKDRQQHRTISQSSPSSSRGAERTLTIYGKIRNAKISVQLLMRRNERNKGVTARILLIVDSEE